MDPFSLGYNVNISLVNPFEKSASDEALRQQTSAIIHDIRMAGGRTARWIVSYIWSQYRCSADPEDQASGMLDPAWYRVTRALLEAAEAENVKVVISMADLADASFATLPREPEKREARIAAWVNRRGAQSGMDHYAVYGGADCARSFQNGYYGTTDARKLFNDPIIIDKFSARFNKMAEFVKDFPALGALELFNEPSFDISGRVEFSRAVKRLRDALRRNNPTLSDLPIYSGVAWWSDEIARTLDEGGDLADEPYVVIHYYGKVASPEAASVNELAVSLTKLRALIPGKQIIVEEAGSSRPLTDRNLHADLVLALLQKAYAAQAGLWFWGEWFDHNNFIGDAKWEFNVRAPLGASFRQILIDTARESALASPRPVAFFNGSEKWTELVRISPAADLVNPRLRARWRLEIGEESYISVTRDGFLRRAPPALASLISEPGATIAIGEAQPDRHWAAVQRQGNFWTLKTYVCDHPQNSVGAVLPTPLYVLQYATDMGRADFASCSKSWLLTSGRL